MNKILKALGRILWFLFVSVLIGYSAYLLNAKLIMHEQLPMICGTGHAVVLSGSMEPAISINDLVIIQKQDTYQTGDIVTYIDDKNTLITHRITEIDGTTVTVKGDANNAADPEFDISRIKGKVTAIIPKAGYAVKFLQNPVCVITIVIIAFILLERSYRKEEEVKTEDINAIKAEIDKLKAAAEHEEHAEQSENDNEN